jgi:hypothetical protein
VQNAGYSFSNLGENVFSHVSSIFHGHAGFEVDWGPGVGGMQTPPGHRTAIHNPAFREIGVGVVFGSNQPVPGSQVPGSTAVGPQLVTQEFGTRHGATPLITGVAYFDLNGNNFYDIGEGVGGVRVSVSGTATEAVTAQSGGYALPIPGDGQYSVTFSGPGFSPLSQEVVVTENHNQKLDFIPNYSPPAITGPSTPVVNRPNSYQISPVPGASVYQWRRAELATPLPEGAENGTTSVSIQQTGSYNVFETGTRKSGSFSFHLAHPQGGIEDQSVLLNKSFLLKTNSVLRFESRLGWATDAQAAVVQISTNNGANWSEVYRQAGSGGAGEGVFQLRTVDLGAFAGSPSRVRFLYEPSGRVFIATDDETGWFIDDITLENTSEIANEQSTDATNTTFSFQPQTVGDFVLEARARTGHDFLPWGPALLVRSVIGGVTPPVLRISGILVANGLVQVEAELVSGASPATLRLQTQATVTGRWTSTTAGGVAVTSTRFVFKTQAPATGKAFYRILAE